MGDKPWLPNTLKADTKLILDRQRRGCYNEHIKAKCSQGRGLTMRHAFARIAERVPDLPRLEDNVEEAEEIYSEGSVAILVARLPAHRGPTTTDYYARHESNGSEVWAVIREGKCTTVMLRRKDQKRTPAAFRVDKVVESVLDYDGTLCYTPETHEDCSGWHHCGPTCCGSCPHCGG